MSKEAETKSKRPPDDAFRQQKLPMFQPIMTPIKVIILFLAIGIAFVPAGVSMLKASDDLFEVSIEYDNGSPSSSNCYVDESTLATYPTGYRSCVSDKIQIDRDITGPLYVYYELTNFYQNHRRYVNSRNTAQLVGQKPSQGELDTACAPTTKSADQRTLNPCGLIANSFFTDVFSIKTSSPVGLELDSTGIAWESDKEKFKQPDGFWSQTFDCSTPPSACPPSYPGCKQFTYNTVSPKVCYQYFYPDSTAYQYLYETYNISAVKPFQPLISPIKGVTDEHFMVWMRTAALPTFRKLYGRIDGVKKGDYLIFNIYANYITESFGGTKSLVISNLNNLGGKNPYLGVSYIVVGSLSLLFGSLFAIKNMISPRPIGSPKLLPWS